MRKLLLDLPSANPALDFDRIAGALAQIIEQSAPQFAVGVFGGWGSGKTTLMHAIERRLDGGRSVPVRFSAWRYEKEEHLIVPLLDTVREALLTATSGDPTLGARARKTASTIGRVIKSIVAGTSVKIGVPGAIDLSFDANKALTYHPSGDEDADVPGSFYHASFRALQQAFEELVGDAHDPAVRIIVFVDDLDRCLPESALQVLESMKLFFDLPGFVFIVGLDQEVVEQVIDSKYARPAAAVATTAAAARDGDADEATEEDRPRARISGAEYIKKIFQLPYRLAPVTLDDLDQFLTAAYAEAELPDAQRHELRSLVAPHLRWVVGDAAVNPREIKRYINAFTLLVEISPAAHLDPRAVLVLQTMAFRGEWRAANDALLAYEDLFADALRRQVDLDEPTALADLDPDLQQIPDDFLQYVAPGAPGHALLEVGPLRPYLSSGEAVRSTQNPRLLEAVQVAGRIRRQLRDAAAQGAELGSLVPSLQQDLSRLESPLRGLSGGPLRVAVERDVARFRAELDQVRPDGAAPVDPAQDAARAKRMTDLAASLVRRVLQLYRQGDVAETIAS